jgi:hypothetical protein
MTKLETIDLATLDNVTGGAGRVGRAASWAWRNVVGPAGGAALVDWAANKWHGTGGQQPSQAPAQPQQ